ncbi:MAG: autotransporter-associated beta strand repeat-containing protein [Verrucomicrobiales bacterium]|jgi:fibronectin-binding autotransporter adhesin|nr:autotransporter-associated beta strand repeat-containing protein [Verrucomicrobiales bacterium]
MKTSIMKKLINNNRNIGAMVALTLALAHNALGDKIWTGSVDNNWFDSANWTNPTQDNNQVNSASVSPVFSGSEDIINALRISAVGTGTLTITSGTLGAKSLVSIGQDGGDGVVNVEGSGYLNILQDNGRLYVGNLNSGTLNIQGSGSVRVSGTFIVANGQYNNSVLNISGNGLLHTEANATANDIGSIGNGTVNISDQGTLSSLNILTLGRQKQGIINLNGGTLKAPALKKGAAAATINANGGTIMATTGTDNFLGGVALNLQAGGLTFDTNTNDITISSAITGADAGGLTKTGAGTLLLTAAGNNYTGATEVSAGTLQLDTAISGVGDLLLSGGILSLGDGVAQTFNTLTVSGAVSITLGTGATLALSSDSSSTDWSAGTLHLDYDLVDALTFAGLSAAQWTHINIPDYLVTGLDNDGKLTLVAIPEPSAGVLLLTGALTFAALFYLRLRRRARRG